MFLISCQQRYHRPFILWFYSHLIAGVLVGASVRAKMASPSLARRLTALLYLIGAFVLGSPLGWLANAIIVPNDLQNSPLQLSMAHVSSQVAAISMMLLSIFWMKLPLITSQVVIAGYLVALPVLRIHVVPFYLEFLAALWITAPIITMGLAYLSRRTVQKWVWDTSDPLSVLLAGLPTFFAIVLGAFTFVSMYWGIFFNWTREQVRLEIALGSSIGGALLVGLLTYSFSFYFGCPFIKKWVFAQFQQAWQEYIPDEEDLKAAERTALEQRGVVVDTEDPPSPSRRSSVSSRNSTAGKNSSSDSSLSRIRAEEAFGYPQLFLLSLLLAVDGGIIYAVANGPLPAVLSQSLVPGMPDLSQWIWRVTCVISIPVGIMLFCSSTFERFIPRYYNDLTAAESFNMEIGCCFPAMMGLIFGAPISVSQCKLIALFIWQWWHQDPQRGLSPTARLVMRDTVLVWISSVLGCSAFSALFAFVLGKVFAKLF